jgi:predicted homoserine dehydrogenase-like protein
MLHQRLAELEREGRPIRVGIIGAGTFGTQIVAQTCRIQGMRVAAIADLKPERAARALSLGGVPREEVQVAKTAGEIDQAMDRGRPAVTAGAEELLGSRVDVVVEATGIPEVGAANGYRAIQQKKHLVMVTVEADSWWGPCSNGWLIEPASSTAWPMETSLPWPPSSATGRGRWGSS